MGLITTTQLLTWSTADLSQSGRKMSIWASNGDNVALRLGDIETGESWTGSAATQATASTEVTGASAASFAKGCRIASDALFIAAAEIEKAQDDLRIAIRAMGSLETPGFTLDRFGNLNIPAPPPSNSPDAMKAIDAHNRTEKSAYVFSRKATDALAKAEDADFKLATKLAEAFGGSPVVDERQKTVPEWLRGPNKTWADAGLSAWEGLKDATVTTAESILGLGGDLIDMTSISKLSDADRSALRTQYAEGIESMWTEARNDPGGSALNVGKIVLNWKDLRDNPAKWVGSIVPDVIAMAFGVGFATKGVKSYAKVLDVVAEGERDYNVATAVAGAAPKVGALERSNQAVQAATRHLAKHPAQAFVAKKLTSHHAKGLVTAPYAGVTYYEGFQEHLEAYGKAAPGERSVKPSFTPGFIELAKHVDVHKLTSDLRAEHFSEHDIKEALAPIEDVLNDHFTVAKYELPGHR